MVFRWRFILPSAITVSRILALLGVLTLWLAERRNAALLLYAYILVTDVVDGWLARRLDSETQIGARLDVVADILVVLSILGLLAVLGDIPVWTPIGPVLVASLFLATSSKGMPRYDPIGKYYGALLYIFVGALLWSPYDLATSSVSFAIAGASVAGFFNRAVYCLRELSSS